MSPTCRVSTFWRVYSLFLLANAGIFLNAKCSDVAAAHESDGGLVEAPVQDQMAGLVNTETAPPPFQPPVSRAETSPQTPAGGDDGYLLQAKEKQQIQRGEARYPSPAGALSRIISMGLLASVVVLMGLVFWEVFNFVGDVDDPLKDVTDPNMIPDAIEDMLVKGKSVAFVVKYCGIGLRAMRKAGKDMVVIMVEGHPHQTVISRYLRTKYGARGFPFFILDTERHGYLTKIVRYPLDPEYPYCHICL